MAKSYTYRVSAPPTEYVAPQTEAQEPEQTSGLDKTLLSGWLNWEVAFWVLIIALAVVTRVVDLGDKAMHHDESIHARWSYDMFKGNFIYRYDPTWHGPFLYYMVSSAFLLFGGDNETTARIMPAIFGIGTVGLCWFLRPLIGKFGALFAGAMVLISPTILYFARSLRHDAFALFGELLFAIAVFRFMQSRKTRWLFFAGVGLVVTYASHELVFLNTGILVAWLVVAFLVEVFALPDFVKARISRYITARRAELKENQAADKLQRTRVVSRRVVPGTKLDELDELEEVVEAEPAEVEPIIQVGTEPDETAIKPKGPWLRNLLVITPNGVLGAGYTLVGVMLIVSLLSFYFASAPKDLVKYRNGVAQGNLLLVGPEIDKWLAYLINGTILAVVLALVAGWLVSLADLVPDEALPGSGAIRGVLRIFRQPWAIAAFFIGFALIYLPLFSNFFTYLPGLADGIYRGVEFWAAAHNLRRLDQPWFYYPMLMMLYETLPFVLSTVALIVVPVAWFRRNLRKGFFVFNIKALFAGYCLWWSFLAMISYSLAGEKVPWLNMQTALPAILGSAILVERQAGKVDWRTLVKPLQGWLFGTMFILMFAIVCVAIGMLMNLGELGKTIQPYANTDIDSTRLYMMLELTIITIIGLALFGYSFWLWRSGRINGRIMRATILIIVILVLAGYGIKSSVLANYQNADIAVEPMVQVQTAPDVPLLVKRLERLSRDVRDSYRVTPPVPGTTSVNIDPAGALGLPILVSNEVSYPLTWYLRAFTSVGYITPSLDAGQPGDAVPLKDSRGNYYGVIIIKGTEDQPKLQEELKGQYTRYETRFRWFFPQYDDGYGSIGKVPPNTPADKVQLEKNKIQNTDWGKLWDSFTKQPSAGQMWRYIMYRQMANPPNSEALVYYVRNELEPDLPVATGQQPIINTGVFDLTTSTKPGSGNGQYRIPRTLAFAPDGSIYVLDSGNARVQKFSADGKFLFSFGKVGTGQGEFNLISLNPANPGANDGGPAGIAVDEEGNVFVADTWNYRIEKFDSNGLFLSAWGQGLDVRNNPDLAKTNLSGFYGPRGLFYDQTKKELYVADTGNRRIIVFDKNGNPLRQFGGDGTQPGQFNEPTGIAVSTDGKVYVTDLRNKRLQILDTTGKYISEISIPDWKEQALSEPYVALDSNGNIYVSDSANSRILKFSKDGAPLGTLGGQVGQSLENPIGLAVGPDGYLYVADGKRHSIVKLLL